jgi:hypothetical protein
MNTHLPAIKKIKIDSKDNVEITMIETVLVPPKEKDGESRTITNIYAAQCQHKPHEDFLAALLSLRKYALEICEFDAGTKTDYKVSSVVISGDMEKEQSSVMFSISKWVKSLGKPVNISTPQVTMYGEEYANAQAMTKQIKKVIEEAFLYLGGKNAEALQLSFNFVMKKAA